MDENQQELNQLIKRSREGDHDAFAQLFEARREQLMGEVKRKVSGPLLRRIDASDVIQEVFMDANRRLEEIAETDLSLIVWLRILVKQKVIDLQRRHIGAEKRSVNRERHIQDNRSDLESFAQQLVADLTSPSMNFQRNELLDQVRAVLIEMSPLDREVLILRHFHSKSNQQVADQLGLSTNAASNRYVRALKRFKSILESIDGTIG